MSSRVVGAAIAAVLLAVLMACLPAAEAADLCTLLRAQSNPGRLLAARCACFLTLKQLLGATYQRYSGMLCNDLTLRSQNFRSLSYSPHWGHHASSQGLPAWHAGGVP